MCVVLERIDQGREADAAGVELVHRRRLVVDVDRGAAHRETQPPAVQLPQPLSSVNMKIIRNNNGTIKCHLFLCKCQIL